MIEDISLIRSIGDIRLFYFKYKDSPQFVLALVVVIGLISFAMVGRFVLPQLESWITLQSQVKSAQKELSVLQANQRIVGSIDQVSLNKQFDISTKALPYEKDYSGIISAIDLATLESSVIRDDYSFSVGNLSTQSAKLADNESISFQLSVSGELSDIKNFLASIKQKLPLSEIVSFSYQGTVADLSIIFFYRSIPRDLKISYLAPISSLSPDNESLLRTLSIWKDKSPEATSSVLDNQPATNSADVTPL
jgi:hypothetical protein